LLIFLVENDDDLSANIWFPEAWPYIHPTVRIFPWSSFHSSYVSSIENARQIILLGYLRVCV
jgi:hypothetical protein